MAHRISENSGMSITAERTPTPAAPTKMPSSAVTIGSPIATTEPNAISEHDDRDADSDQLAARCLLRQQRERSGELDLHAARVGRVGDGKRVVELRGGQLVEGVGDIEVASLPVGADGRSLRCERVGDGDNGGSSAELGSGLLDGCVVICVVEPPVVGVQHDAGRQPTLAREPVVQDIGGVLRLDARDSLAVVELSAGAALEAPRRRGRRAARGRAPGMGAWR